MDELHEYRKKILEEKTKLIAENFIERCENRPSYAKRDAIFETNNELNHISGSENMFSPKCTMHRAISDIFHEDKGQRKDELKIDDIGINGDKVSKKFIVILPDEYSDVDNVLKMAQEEELAIKLKIYWHDPSMPYGGGLDKFSEIGDDGSEYLTAYFSKDDCKRIANAIEKAKDIPSFYSLNVNGTNVILSPKTDYIFEYQQIHITNEELLTAIKNIKDNSIAGKNVQKSSDFIENVKKFFEKFSGSKENAENVDRLLNLIESSKQILENNKKALTELGHTDALEGCEKDLSDIEKVEKWINDGNRYLPNVLNFIKALDNKNLEKMLVEDKFDIDIEK